MADKKLIRDIKPRKDLPHRFRSYSPAKESIDRSLPPKAGVEIQMPRRRLWKRIIIIFLIILIGAVILISVWDARNISAAERKMFGSGNLLNLIDTKPLKSTADNRVNILLVGYSVDDPGHPASTLTDSIILLSMSTTRHAGYMLSIPRDLYVKIPGFGYGKINEAYQDGG